MSLTIKQQRYIKKNFKVILNDGPKVGEVKLTRISVKEWRRYDGMLYTTCEVDIEYWGTISLFGIKMGPTKEVTESKWGTGWRSKQQRNRSLRSQVITEMKDLLKYYGIDVVYKHNLKIKKIIWTTHESKES